MPTINNVPTTQYIGPKIVPHFANPTEWNINSEYDALSIVTNNGNTYWAKYNVPSGIDISNTEYWYLSSYPDSQIQQYRQEVANYAATVESFSSRISTLETTDVSHGSAINTLEHKVTDLETDVTKLQALPPAVFIGDSFTSAYYLIQNGQSEQKRWCYPVARAVGCTPYIYAERGAGFTRAGTASEGGHTFSGMLDVAAADTSFNNSDVKYVFVYGGLNDIDHENAQTAFTTNFSNWCTKARNLFPNANIIVCGINAWPESLSLYEYVSGTNHYQRSQIFYEYTMTSQNAFKNANCAFISTCGALGFNSDYYYSDNRHPNPLGNEAIATWIISAMFGSGITSSVSGKIKGLNTTAEGGNVVAHFHPNLLEVFVTIPSAYNDDYVTDTFNIMRDQGLDLRGVPLMYESSGQPIYGYLGAKDNATSPYGYVHSVNYGFGHFVRAY